MSALNGWISDIESVANTGASIYGEVSGKTIQPGSSTASGTSPNPPTSNTGSPVLSSSTQSILLYGGIAVAVIVGLWFVVRN